MQSSIRYAEELPFLTQSFIASFLAGLNVRFNQLFAHSMICFFLWLSSCNTNRFEQLISQDQTAVKKPVMPPCSPLPCQQQLYRPETPDSASCCSSCPPSPCQQQLYRPETPDSASCCSSGQTQHAAARRQHSLPFRLWRVGLPSRSWASAN